MKPWPDLPPTFTTAEARAVGLRYSDLYAARDDGWVIELSRGVFRLAEEEVPSWPDLLAVSRRAPRGVICLLSAANVHELTDIQPEAVQLAVPRGTWPPKIDYPPVEVFVWKEPIPPTETTMVEAAPGEPVPITSAARTVVDLMRLRSRVGEEVANLALKRFVDRKLGRSSEVAAIARRLDVRGPVLGALDVLTAS